MREPLWKGIRPKLAIAPSGRFAAGFSSAGFGRPPPSAALGGFFSCSAFGCFSAKVCWAASPARTLSATSSIATRFILVSAMFLKRSFTEAALSKKTVPFPFSHSGGTKASPKSISDALTPSKYNGRGNIFPAFAGLVYQSQVRGPTEYLRAAFRMDRKNRKRSSTVNPADATSGSLRGHRWTARNDRPSKKRLQGRRRHDFRSSLVLYRSPAPKAERSCHRSRR